MGKRKHRPILHQQEQCDVWLSTAEKKEQTPSAKRQRVFRPITNIADLVLSSQPIKAGTKQTDIKNFFAPKPAKVKETTVPNASTSLPPFISKGSSTSSSSNLERSKKLKTEPSPPRKCQNSGGLSSLQNNDAKITSAISITTPGDRPLNLTESVDTIPVPGNNSTLLQTTKESEFSNSSQELKDNDRIQFSQDVSQISSADQESECITFTLSSQGCLKSRDVKTNRHKNFDIRHPQIPSNRNAVCSGVSVNSSDISDSPCSPSFLSMSNAMNTFAPAYYDSNKIEESEDISFSMGTEVCLKTKLPCLNSDDSELSNTQDDIHESPSISSQDSMQEVIFTMGSQGCLKVRDPKGHRSNITQSQSSEDLPQDVEFTMGTQGCLKVRDLKGHRSNITQSQSSEDLSQDVEFTMGTQGCLKVRDPKGHRSNIKRPPTHFDSTDSDTPVYDDINSDEESDDDDEFSQT